MELGLTREYREIPKSQYRELFELLLLCGEMVDGWIMKYSHSVYVVATDGDIEQLTL